MKCHQNWHQESKVSGVLRGGSEVEIRIRSGWKAEVEAGAWDTAGGRGVEPVRAPAPSNAAAPEPPWVSLSRDSVSRSRWSLFGATLPPAHPRLREILTPPPTRSPLLGSSSGVGPEGEPFFPFFTYRSWALGNPHGSPLACPVVRGRDPKFCSQNWRNLCQVWRNLPPFSFRGGEECCLSPFFFHLPHESSCFSNPKGILCRFPESVYGVGSWIRPFHTHTLPQLLTSSLPSSRRANQDLSRVSSLGHYLGMSCLLLVLTQPCYVVL